jgi:hypothetical protein
MTFRFSNLQNIGNSVSVSIPKDEHGYLGRECPEKSCLGYFKIRPGTGLPGTDIPCHCPYCGHAGSPNTFYTHEQIEYAKSVALRQIGEAIREDLKSLEFEFKPKGAFGIGISMKLQPGTPLPLRQYRERTLETEIRCDQCTLEYSVYGVFAYCPDCGVHNSHQILLRNLDLARRQVELARTIEDIAFRKHMIEDALENCVSAFDGFGREICRRHGHVATSTEKINSVSFQNMDRAAIALERLYLIDLRSLLSNDDWLFVVLCFNRRHILAHNSGVIDNKYLLESGDSTAQKGRRINIPEADVARLAEVLGVLGLKLVECFSEHQGPT